MEVDRILCDQLSKLTVGKNSEEFVIPSFPEYYRNNFFPNMNIFIEEDGVTYILTPRGSNIDCYVFVKEDDFEENVWYVVITREEDPSDDTSLKFVKNSEREGGGGRSMNWYP